MTEPVGTLADEAVKLLAAAESWWRDHAPDHAGPECRVCPFCQVLSVVRGTQPELFERLTEVATSLLATLRPETPDAAPRRADVPVERIDIA